MTVAQILEQKGRNVITATSQETVQNIIMTLAENKIGAIVIVDGQQKTCGIVSERDLVRLLAERGSDALTDKVENCMTHDVISCEEADTVPQVMAKMTMGRFRHLPVITNGQLAGMISIGDVVKARIEAAEREAEEMKRYIAG